MRNSHDIEPWIVTEFEEVNGLRYEVDKHGDQSSDKLAVCLHGFPEHSISWHFQLRMLGELGYKVWAPNLRGYGNSSIPPDMQDYQLEVLMNDIGCLIDAADVDPKKTALIAHDWGGVIAWYFSTRQIRPLSKLIVCNAPHPAAFIDHFGWSQFKKSWYVLYFQIPYLPELIFRWGGYEMGEMIRSSSAKPENIPQPIVDLFTENGHRRGGMTAMLNYYRALIRGGGARRQHDLGYATIETPTLMCWGEDDPALGKPTTYGTDKWVSDLVIRYLPNISHWVQQDAPAEVNGMMEAFLTDKPVPSMKWESKLVQP